MCAAKNTELLAVSVMLPDDASGVMVAAGLDELMVNACLGTKLKDRVLTVHDESDAPLTIFCGAIPSCTTINVSADCAQHIVEMTELVINETLR